MTIFKGGWATSCSSIPSIPFKDSMISGHTGHRWPYPNLCVDIFAHLTIHIVAADHVSCVCVRVRAKSFVDKM